MTLTPEEKEDAKKLVMHYLKKYPEEIASLETELKPDEIEEIVYKTSKKIAPRVMVESMRKCNELAEELGIRWKEETVKRQQAVSLCMFVAGRFAGGEKP